MENNFRPYSDPKNLNFFRTIGSEVILDVAPDEELTANKLIDRILQRYELGDVVVADAAPNDPGSFGPIDLVTLVVIPLLVSTVGEICKQLVVWSIEDLKTSAKNDNTKKLSQMIDIIVEEKYEEIKGKVKSKKSRSKGKAIRDAVKIHVKTHLELK